MRVDRVVKAVVAALEDIKARDIAVLNVVKLSPLFDRMIIATGDSTRQVKALADNVQEKLKAAGAKVTGVEGAQSAEWILVDLGNVIVHVMLPTTRAHYNLEELWTVKPLRKPKRATATTGVGSSAES